MDTPQQQTAPTTPNPAPLTHSTDAWQQLADDYEQARTKADSLDRLVEWPAQRELLGDVAGRSVLDVGCGSGHKVAQLVADGAVASVGVDVNGNFPQSHSPELELITGDLNNLASLPGVAGRTFDRVLFLQSFGYATDPVATLRTAKALLAPGGFIVLTRTQPVRYAIQRAEQNGTTLGEEYFAGKDFTYGNSWNESITLTKRSYTMADLLNTFSAAGFWVAQTIEPQMPAAAQAQFPHKQEWLNKYLGILMFKLRPLPGQ